MKVKLEVITDKLAGNFWFLPSMMTAGAIGLAIAMVALDHSGYGDMVRRGTWLERIHIDSARLIVSTIAGSMITVTSLVFSLTLVALTLASQQLGPRLMSVFRRDRMTQIVLGLFVSTFMYSLLVLAALREIGGVTPVFSVSVALLLAMVSVGFLLSFIHHLSSAIQADSMIARIGGELVHQVHHLFPDLDDDDGSELETKDTTEPEDPTEIEASRSGYVQTIDLEQVSEYAHRHDLEVHLRCLPGEFVCAGQALAHASPKDQVTDAARAAINAAIVLGPTRTPVQDLEFSMGAIVEIALRALSPGVNDPHTALTCVDYLGDTLSRVLRRGTRPARHHDDTGTLRVVAPTFSFDDLIDMAFNEIRQSARENVAVTLRLLDTLVRLAPLARTIAQKGAVRRHVDMLERSSHRHITEPADLEDVNRRLAALQRILDRDLPA